MSSDEISCPLCHLKFIVESEFIEHIKGNHIVSPLESSSSDAQLFETNNQFTSEPSQTNNQLTASVPSEPAQQYSDIFPNPNHGILHHQTRTDKLVTTIELNPSSNDNHDGTFYSIVENGGSINTQMLARHQHSSLYRPQSELTTGGINIPHITRTGAEYSELHRMQQKMIDECRKKFKRTFPCIQCPKTFTRLDSLRTHILRAHDASQRCSCQICGRAFSCPRNLKDHTLRAHKIKRQAVKLVENDEGIYSCAYCEEKFRYAWEVNSHEKMNHAETVALVKQE